MLSKPTKKKKGVNTSLELMTLRAEKAEFDLQDKSKSLEALQVIQKNGYEIVQSTQAIVASLQAAIKENDKDAAQKNIALEELKKIVEENRRSLEKRTLEYNAIHDMAFIDALTGLPNRRLLNDRLNQIILNNKRWKSFSAAVFVDLDKFKTINDTYGHDAGDEVLLAVANRLKACIRDSDTGNHIRRTQHYVKVLAEKLRDHPKFAWYLTDANINLLFKSAPLHDIGKVGIPDSILLKPGKLTPEEFEIMKTHTTLGFEAISHAETSLGTKVEFLTCAKSIILSHQEKWDGSGYPQGLTGEDIPIAARLMAVEDVYDALICRRVYKEPIPHPEAVIIMTKGSGIHFDAEMIKAFIEIQDQFLEISKKFSDDDESIDKKALYIQQALGNSQAKLH